MNPEDYVGKEQTYSKQLFLKRYLERVAYHIATFHPEFVYVDGFSGPWHAKDENLADTSFMIAINKLKDVRVTLRKAGKYPRFRCLFIEKDPTSFATLETATQSVKEIETQAKHGSFESLIPEVRNFIGTSFSLVFIDPTGWTGFSMERIRPILNLKSGEVIVNFMFDYINRFLNLIEPKFEDQFDQLFGTSSWRSLREANNRESAIVDFYAEQLRTNGKFEFVTYTPILNPSSDRTYFYLMYCTRHIKGLIEFRAIERQTTKDQQDIRVSAKKRKISEVRNKRVVRTGQFELGLQPELQTNDLIENERRRQISRAKSHFIAILSSGSPILYESLLGRLLIFPFVCEGDAKTMIREAQNLGALVVEGLSERQRVPRFGSVLKATDTFVKTYS